MALPTASLHLSHLSRQSVRVTSPKLKDDRQPATPYSPTTAASATGGLTFSHRRPYSQIYGFHEAPPPLDVAEELIFPTELLHLIFSFALEPSSTDISLEEKTTLRTTIVSISHTSQHWRFAARDCSNLWSNAIDFQRQPVEVIADYLELSKPHPIDVGHHSEPYRVEDQRDILILDLLKAESSRIREWNVQFPPAEDQPHPSRGWLFPSTEQPSVTAIRYIGVFTSSLWDLWALSSTLCKLSIRDPPFFLPLRSPIQFDALTELKVSGVSMDFRPNAWNWMASLKRMPNLQFLALHNTVSRRAANGMTDLHLPHLRLVSVQDADWDSVRALGKLLRHLHVPSTCATLVEFPSTSGFRPTQDTDLRTIMRGFRRVLRRHIVGIPGMAGPDAMEVPPIELSVHSSSAGCRVSLGTVPRADVTLDWNAEGSRAVNEYLDNHGARYQRFAPFNVSFNEAMTDDVDQLSDFASETFAKAQSVRIDLDTTTASRPSFERIAHSLVLLLNRSTDISTLSLGVGAHSVLQKLMVMLPLTGGDHKMRPALPKLRLVVLEAGKPGYRVAPSIVLKVVKTFVDWREQVKHPVEVKVEA